jgi:hypothetical protein
MVTLASELAGDVETSGLSEGLYIKNRGLCEEWIGVVVLEVSSVLVVATSLRFLHICINKLPSTVIFSTDTRSVLALLDCVRASMKSCQRGIYGGTLSPQISQLITRPAGSVGICPE